jgi:MYXO-CTERM domain-containing protein
MRSLRLAAILFATSIASPALAAPSKVACVGASATAGTGSTPGHHYPDDLGTLLGPSYLVHNFGVGSTTMLKAGNPSYWNTPALQSALAFAPDIAVFWFGGNDSKYPLWEMHGTEFLSDYESMVRQFQALPSHPRTFIILSIVIHDVYGIRKQIVDNQIVPLLRQAAAETGSGVVDVHDALAGHPEDFPDGVHPNDMGALAVAQLVQAALLAPPDDGGAADAGSSGSGEGGNAANDAAADEDGDLDAATPAPAPADAPSSAMGPSPDAGSPAGAAGSPPAPTGSSVAAGGGGCGCRSAPADAPRPWLAVMGLLIPCWRRARRRVRRSH